DPTLLPTRLVPPPRLRPANSSACHAFAALSMTAWPPGQAGLRKHASLRIPGGTSCQLVLHTCCRLGFLAGGGFGGRRLADDADQPPVLQLRQRPRFHDLDGVAAV